MPPPSVVIATRNRAAELDRTLERLAALPEQPPVVVVDNASDDESATVVGDGHPGVRLIRAPRNLGAAARNIGVSYAPGPYVAFSDDDSWWAPGALARASALLDAHPVVGLVAACVLVGPEGRIDPTCEVMARSPLPALAGVPGCPVLGFLACGAVVRRSAFLDVGGFEPRLQIGGEEQLLALELRRRGHRLQYVPSVVVHHHPSAHRDDGTRRRQLARNGMWAAWLRRPPGVAWRVTVAALRRARVDEHARAGLVDAVRAGGWVLRERRAVDSALEAELRMLES